jgi:hypothetical protein
LTILPRDPPLIKITTWEATKQQKEGLEKAWINSLLKMGGIATEISPLVQYQEEVHKVLSLYTLM